MWTDIMALASGHSSGKQELNFCLLKPTSLFLLLNLSCAHWIKTLDNKKQLLLFQGFVLHNRVLKDFFN